MITKIVKQCWRKVSRKLKSKELALAIVIHVFHIDLLDEIFESLNHLNVNFELYISTLPEYIALVEEKLSQTKYSYYLLECENRGRDILPFLKLLPIILNKGHQFLLKIHTKKSGHCSFGDEWRKDMLLKLLKRNEAKVILEFLKIYPSIGMIAPEGYLMPVRFTYSNNQRVFDKYLEKLNIENHTFTGLNFPAGSMFYARTSIFKPIVDLRLTEEHFEEEHGQIDGTLAHGVERAFGACAYLSGKKLVDTSVCQPINKKGLLTLIMEEKSKSCHIKN